MRTTADGEPQFTAWCFGQGSRWLRRQAVSPRFGLLVALNALADSASPGMPGDVGIVGASVAARDGNLRRASLTAAVPAPADAIPRIDTLADVLTAARISTGHDVLGRVSACRSLQFPDVVGSVERFRELSAVIAKLATQDGYRQSHGWIDHTVPEADEQIIEVILDQIWRGFDDEGQVIKVDIAWWEDLRETGSDHPVTHWRVASERKERHPSRRVTLTWPAVKAALGYRMDPATPGHKVLATDIRFFADDEELLGRCSVAELLSAELSLDETTYVLIDGQVCRVDASFLAALDQELAEYVVASRLVPYRPGELEAAYNSRAAEATGMLLLDTKDIRPPGATQIEPCDLLGLDGALCHVKRHTTASGISHLANQAVSSATVLLREHESRKKLGALIQKGTWKANDKRRVRRRLDRMAISPMRPPVILAIVGEWEEPTIKSLSLLSRLALRTAALRLRDLGFRVQLMLIDSTR